MNKLQKLEELKEEIRSLERGYSRKREGLLLKTRVIIDNFFNDKRQYLQVLTSINLLFGGVYSEGDNTSKERMWNTGKDKFLNLIDTLIYDLEMSEGLRDGNMITQKNSSDKSKVFIVHGHDDGAKNEVARFIEKLGLEAIIVHEQTSSGDTIIEKVIRYSDVGFGVVLYTGCDIGAVKSEPDNLKLRARQNVIFEHGFLIGKIGRKNVIALVKDNVEKPNDISGVVYETIDSKGAWKFQLAREMKASGYDIDMNKVS